MKRTLADSVVVITGASSGIGRAAARAFVKRGARVVLAARREHVLRELAQELGQGGGKALAVRTDVTDEGAVLELARRAAEAFGRIDVWVNNAAVSLFGRVEEVPMEAHRRVIETNLIGSLHGARAALPYFREEGSGVLLNVAAVVAAVGQPYTSAYVATKWAIRGLSECLRMELALDGARDIHVSTLMPASIDTPLFQHAANYTGRAVKPMGPVYDAEEVAEAIVDLAERPRRERFVGPAGRLVALEHAVLPALSEWMMARRVESSQLEQRAAAPSSGNLFEPTDVGTGVSGGWGGGRSNAGPLAAAALAAAGLAAWYWIGRARR